MRIKICTLLMALVLCAVPAKSQDKDTLAVFIENNPNAVDFNVIYEGTKLNLSADEEFLLVHLSVAHPALQMRFLMQKASIYVDPSGKKRKKYAVNLPSALDVKEELEAAKPQVDDKREMDTRPDIRPLLSALNKKGASFIANGETLHLGYQHFYIELDTQNELVNYYILIPKVTLMNDSKLSDKWSVGIFSINDFSNMPPPEQEGEVGMMPPQEGECEEQLAIQKLMQADIRVWTKFSIDDVNNANLK